MLRNVAPRFCDSVDALILMLAKDRERHFLLSAIEKLEDSKILDEVIRNPDSIENKYR